MSFPPSDIDRAPRCVNRQRAAERLERAQAAYFTNVDHHGNFLAYNAALDDYQSIARRIIRTHKPSRVPRQRPDVDRLRQKLFAALGKAEADYQDGKDFGVTNRQHIDNVIALRIARQDWDHVSEVHESRVVMWKRIARAERSGVRYAFKRSGREYHV